MAGLVSYASSDEEEDVQEKTDLESVETLNAAEAAQSSQVPTNGTKAELQTNGTSSERPRHQPEAEAPIVGPSLGPSQADFEMLGALEEEYGSAPQSPYSANRSLLRDLTYPTAPNLDIPASPPGSPVASTNAKFKHFLDLKKQGIHFNDKLANSAALKNPSLMQKLMDFSDINESSQYATTLPKDLWDPTSFPEYAYKEGLTKSQQKILKRKEDEKARGQREIVDFVPATTMETSSRSGMPGAGARGSQKSAAERIMAGLDRGRSSSPQVAGMKRKTRFDS